MWRWSESSSVETFATKKLKYLKTPSSPRLLTMLIVTSDRRRAGNLSRPRATK
jgi:hypothetical protein